MVKSPKAATIYCSTSESSKILPTFVWWGARTCPCEMSAKFCDFAELISLLDFKTFVAAVLTDFCQMVPVKSWKNRVRVFEAKKQFLLYAAWGFATDRQGGPCWMLVDTKEQNVSLRFYILFFHANSAKFFSCIEWRPCHVVAKAPVSIYLGFVLIR